MIETKSGDEKARMVLDCFKAAGAKANEVVGQDKLLQAAASKHYTASDIMDGILFGEANGLFAHETETSIKITSAGFEKI